MTRRYIPQGYDLYVSFNYQTPSFLLPEGGRNIAWVHTSVYDLAEEGMKYYRQLQCRAFEKAVRIVSISDITTKSIQTLFPEHAAKIVEIYNAVDVSEIRKKAESDTEIVLEHPAVIYVGRLDENKDPLRMVDLFQGLASRNNPVHLYFLGSGELEMRVREKVREYELENQIHFLGYLENPFPVIKQADVSCVTSRSEGFPMRLLESVALHVPFVSTEVGGAAILANGEQCGRVFRTDKEAVRDLSELLNMPKSFIREACEKSIGRFDLKVYIAQIEQLFDSILEKPFVFMGSTVGNTVWDNVVDDGLLEDRAYYYHFPDGLIPKGSKVILYGAGNVGTDYYHYMQETDDCRIAAWVDAEARNHRNRGKDVSDVDAVLGLEYDVILIAVANETAARSIRGELRMRGIPDGRIVWTRPIF